MTDEFTPDGRTNVPADVVAVGNPDRVIRTLA